MDERPLLREAERTEIVLTILLGGLAMLVVVVAALFGLEAAAVLVEPLREAAEVAR